MTASRLPSDEPLLPLSAVSASFEIQRDDDIVGKRIGRDVELVVAYLVAVNISSGDFVFRRLQCERAFAVRGELDMRNAGRGRDGGGLRHVGAVDFQHADSAFAAIGHQRHVAFRADRQTGQLFADGDPVAQVLVDWLSGQ